MLGGFENEPKYSYYSSFLSVNTALLHNSFNHSIRNSEPARGPVDQPGYGFISEPLGNRSPPWHGGGREFKSHPVHHHSS